MKKIKSLLMLLKNRLPLFLLIFCVAVGAIAGAAYSKYINNLDLNVDMNISAGDIQIKVVKDSDGKYSICHASGSTIPAYIRFAVVVNWKNTTDDTLWYISPGEVVIYAPCAQLLNGYYYCVADGSAVIPIDKVLSYITVTTSASAPDDCELYVQILAEGIQCLPANAVKEAWGVTFEDGAWKQATP